MKYMGSKNRIANKILPIILQERREDQWYVEPFLGGANIMDKVQGPRLGWELNPYVAEMWRALLDGWFPGYISKESYISIRDNKNDYPAELVGWVGIACSYSGKWFGGYAGVVDTKQGVRDYQAEAIRNVRAQMPSLTGLRVQSCCYSALTLPAKSVIYCDPPYAGTTKYKDDFDHDNFWEWCREKVGEGHSLYVSEYNSPPDFVAVWSQEVKSSLSANGKAGGSKRSLESLFMHKSQIATQQIAHDRAACRGAKCYS